MTEENQESSEKVGKTIEKAWCRWQKKETFNMDEFLKTDFEELLEWMHIEAKGDKHA